MGSWVEEIAEAMKALGGHATYTELYKFIQKTTNRKLTREWKASVRRTIEDHSSDSDNFRSYDLFFKIKRGHWGLRIDDINSEERGNYTQASEKSETADRIPTETENMVFVREHWRRYPGDGDQSEQIEAVRLDLDRMKLSNAWVTSTHVDFAFENGARIELPISIFRELEASTIERRQRVTVKNNRVNWPNIPLEISLARLLLSLMDK